MDMDGDQCLKFGTFDLGKVTGRLVNKQVEKIHETLVCLTHDLTVITRVLQSISRVSSPNQL